MKMVITYIRSEQLPAVKQALFDVQIKHISAMTVMGTASKTEQKMFRGVQEEVTLFRRLRLEIFVQDATLERTIEAITRGTQESGGYGKIFVVNLEDVIKPWTGERGPKAL